MKQVLLGSMIIWVGVIFSAALVLPESFGKLIVILGGGAAGHLIIIGGQLQKEQKKDDR